MEDYQKRVVEEKDELAIKLEKLSAFVSSHLFVSLPVEEKRAQLTQKMYMEGYLDTLIDRISRF